MLIAIICLFTGFTLGFFTAALCQAASHSDSDRKNNQSITAMTSIAVCPCPVVRTEQTDG